MDGLTGRRAPMAPRRGALKRVDAFMPAPVYHAAVKQLAPPPFSSPIHMPLLPLRHVRRMSKSRGHIQTSAPCRRGWRMAAAVETREVLPASVVPSHYGTLA